MPQPTFSRLFCADTAACPCCCLQDKYEKKDGYYKPEYKKEDSKYGYDKYEKKEDKYEAKYEPKYEDKYEKKYEAKYEPKYEDKYEKKYEKKDSYYKEEPKKDSYYKVGGLVGRHRFQRPRGGVEAYYSHHSDHSLERPRDKGPQTGLHGLQCCTASAAMYSSSSWQDYYCYKSLQEA
jgi:hypothetical protein